MAVHESCLREFRMQLDDGSVPAQTRSQYDIYEQNETSLRVQECSMMNGFAHSSIMAYSGERILLTQ
jgi:hypothetical protein